MLYSIGRQFFSPSFLQTLETSISSLSFSKPSKFLLRCLVGFLGSFSHRKPSPLPLLSSVSPELPHLCLSSSKSIAISSSLAPPPQRPRTLLSDSTRTLSSLLALALSVSKHVLSLPAHITTIVARAVPSSVELTKIRDLRGSLACAVGPLFFVALKDRSSGYLNTPLTMMALGMAKWLNIYSGVLMVRVLLSSFPNIPWDRRPLSAIRDLCDPYCCPKSPSLIR